MPWKCFMLRPTKMSKLSLRRYGHGNGCPLNNGHYHNAEFPVPDVETFFTKEGYITIEDSLYEKYPKDYPDWPKNCICGYQFVEEDAKQLFQDQIFKTDTNEEYTLRNAPIGAMWDAWWLKGASRFKQRPDGMCLIVRTPGGDWMVDGPSSNGNGWERTGEVPNITASPSILCQKAYHGYLKNGVLTDDVDGRKFVS